MTYLRRRILIVENETFIASIWGEFLSADAGYGVALALDGEVAIKALAGPEAFDLAVIDLRIRQGSGLDIAARAIAQDVPVVLTSGDPGGAESAAALGARFLCKPFLLADLLREVGANIARSRRNIESARAEKARTAENIRLLRDVMGPASVITFRVPQE